MVSEPACSYYFLLEFCPLAFAITFACNIYVVDAIVLIAEMFFCVECWEFKSATSYCELIFFVT